jgi:hypothetical protein
MNDTQRVAFFKLYNRQQRRNRDRKLFVPSYDKQVPVWNHKHVEVVKDLPLREFLLHVSKIKFDADFDFAVKMKHSVGQQRVFCTIGYSIYAGIPDWKIAYRHKLRFAQVRAIREIFFDFSCAPTDPVARAAYLTQLADNEVITDVDRRYFKMVATLGELGLKADADASVLTPEERERMQLYLADSMIENVAALYFSIDCKRDALAYSQVINSLGTFMSRREDIILTRARVRNVDAATARIVNEKTDYNAQQSPEDIRALEMLEKLSSAETSEPKYRLITELNEPA